MTWPLLSVASLLLILLSVCSDAEVRMTSWGAVRGELVHPGHDLSPVEQYLGIPYGVAPTGQFRFNMAISAAKWTHMTKDTTRLSLVCNQQFPELREARAMKASSAQHFDHLHRLLPRLQQQAEDCLYMNLFVPHRPESSQRDLPLGVLVVVHGDEYSWNAGNPYNGSALAAHGQLIVVTLNYRLGVYGFLGRCEASSCTGNSGISDLVSALTMLNSVLPAFGGDPKAITLLGWGSGASLVSLLMASPLTQPGRRLFRRAILLDGSALSPWAMQYNPQPYFMQLADQLGCLPKNRSSTFNDDVNSVLRCTQEHSSDNVTRAASKIEAPSFLSLWAPIVDGQLIPNRPRVSFSPTYGALFREIDLMVGLSSNPAHHLLSNDDLLHGISKERKEKILRTLVRNLYEYHRTEILASISSEYTDWDNPKEHPKSIRNGVLNALGDVLYTAPLIETLRMHSSDESRKESNTFMFVFGHETKTWMNEHPNSGIRGSLSNDHLPYILGYPLFSADADEALYRGFNADDRGLSRVMMHYVANFVKSGDPSRPLSMPRSFATGDAFHATAWPQFEEKSREAYLEITDRPRIKNYYRNAQVGFWTGLVPQLHSAGREGVTVPEEHHLLPDHLKRDTFFGRVRPFASFANDPFPPPPMPPSPPPEGAKKGTNPKPVTPAPVTETPTVQHSGGYNSYMAVTIVIGCMLTMLNLCICMGLYQRRRKHKTHKHKMQLQYQTYTSNHTGATTSVEPYNSLNSPVLSSKSILAMRNHMQMSLMPPPPPSIAQDSSSLPFSQPSGGTLPRYSFQEQAGASDASRPLTPLQEPLLKASVASRSGVSPTCPRHGRAALAGRGDSSRGNSIAAPLEEIQV